MNKRLKIITVGLLALVFLVSSTMGVLAAAQQPAQPKTAFTDVTASNSNKLFITYLANRGIMNGYPNKTFKPLSGLTRAEAAAVLVKAANLKTGDTKSGFKDVGTKHWAGASITAARKAGILTGYADGTFRPQAKLTRAEAIALIVKMSKQPDPGVELPTLADVGSKHWAARPIAVGLAAEMVGLSSDNKHFLPNSPMTRGSLARALAILLTKDSDYYVTALTDQLKYVKGPVTIIREGSTTPETVKGNTELKPGDKVSTGDGGIAELVFPDGTGLRLEEKAELTIKETKGRSYIKPDGMPGTAVELLDVQLKQGKMFGALATPAESVSSSSQAQAAKVRAAGFESYLSFEGMGIAAGPASRVTKAAAAGVLPWWKTSGVKRTKVKIDMPTGVAAIRGTFWENLVNQDGTFTTSLLTGEAEITAGGQTVGLAAGQKTEVTKPDAPPVPPAPLSAAEKASWVEVKQWALERAQDIKTNQEVALPEPAPADKPEQTVTPTPEQPRQETPATVPDLTKQVGDAFTNNVEGGSSQPQSATDTGGDESPARVPLAVVNTSPVTGAIGVPVYNNIRVSFNQAIAQGDGFNSITLTDGANSTVSVNLQISNNMLIITPTPELNLGSTYTVHIPQDGIKDSSGTGLTAAYNFSFATTDLVTVTGKVYNPDGTVFNSAANPDATVELYTAFDGYRDSTLVGTGGSYSLSDIMPGQYFMRVAGSSTYTNSNLAAIEIPQGTKQFEQNITLTNPSLTGRVYKPDGTSFIPDTSTIVNIYISPVGFNTWEEQIKLKDDGTFQYGGLPTGDYVIRTLVSGNSSFTDALPVTVHITEGANLETAVYLTNPTVSGTVYLPDGFTPYTGYFSLSIMPLNSDYLQRPISTNGVNGFQLGGLPTGDYQLDFYVEYQSSLFARPVTIHVNQGTPLTQNVILSYANVPVDNGGIGIPGSGTIEVRVFKPDGSLFVPSDYSDVSFSFGDAYYSPYQALYLDGKYTITGIGAGSYSLTAHVEGVGNPYTDSLPVNVQVYANSTQPVDIFLTNGPTLTGSVLTPEGNPFILTGASIPSVLAGASIPSIQKSRMLLYLYSDSYSTYTEVNIDGTYKFGDLLPTGSYSMLVEYYGYSPYVVPSGLHINYTAGTALTQNINLSYPSLEGRVLAPNTGLLTGYEYAQVELQDLNGKVVGSGYVNEDGTYRIPPVPNGTYLLATSIEDPDSIYSNAVPSSITTDGTVKTRDITLTTPKVIGRILSPDNKIITGAGVNRYVEIQLINAEGKILDSAYTDLYGRFSLGGVAAGTYLLKAVITDSNSAYTDQYSGFRLDGVVKGNYLLQALTTPYVDSTPVQVQIQDNTTLTQNLNLTVASAQTAGVDGYVGTSGEPFYVTDQQVVIKVDDANLNTNYNKMESVAVNVKSSVTDPTGVAITLTEEGVNSDSFIGYVTIVSPAASSGPGLIRAGIGESVTVTYIDALNSAGQVNTTKQTNVTVTDLARNLTFSPSPALAGTIAGNLLWQPAANETALTHYEVYFLNSYNAPLGPSIGSVAKGTTSYSLSIPQGTAIPAGATQLGVFSVNADHFNYRPNIAAWVALDYLPTLVPVQSVSLNVNSLTFVQGGPAESLGAIVTPDSATNTTLSWSSNAPLVATVSSNGLVTPVAPGIATITVTTVDGGYTDYCEVTVAAPSDITPPSIVGISPQALEAPVNTPIIIDFDEAVQPGPAIDGISITSSGATVVSFTYSFSSFSLILTPVNDLVYSTLYTVDIPAGAVQDMSGNSLPDTPPFSFTTVAEPITAAGWSSSQSYDVKRYRLGDKRLF